MRWYLEAAAVVGLLTLFLIPVINWSSLPPKLPTHFDFEGNPEAWGPRRTIWVLPTIGAGLSLIFTVAGMIAAKRVSAEISEDKRAARVELELCLLAALKAEMVSFFAYGCWQTIRVGRGEAHGLGPVVPVLLVTIGITAAVYFRRKRRLTHAGGHATEHPLPPPGPVPPPSVS